MLNSFSRSLCRVAFPEYAGRQHYMHELQAENPSVPEGYEGYLEPVTALLAAAQVEIGTVYLTVDEKIVQPGMSQRKPGPHVDGQFMKERMSWGHASWSHPTPTPPPGGSWGHPYRTSWAHNCNIVPLDRMPVIVAADVMGCRVWTGQFDAQPSDCGDLSHIADQLGEGEMVPANMGFLLSPDCIHESMIFSEPTQRSFLRLALPVAFGKELEASGA